MGQLSLGVSYVDAANTLFLGNAHELLHTSGGGVNGLKSRYFGEPGTGEILAMTLDLRWRLRETFKPFSRALARVLGRSEHRLFGLSAHVVSIGQDEQPDLNFHDRQWFKWGSEFTYRPVNALKGGSQALDMTGSSSIPTMMRSHLGSSALASALALSATSISSPLTPIINMVTKFA